MGDNEPMVVLEQGDYVTWVEDFGGMGCGQIYLVESHPTEKWIAWIVKKHPEGEGKAGVTIEPMKSLTKIDPAIYKLF